MRSVLAEHRIGTPAAGRRRVLGFGALLLAVLLTSVACSGNSSIAPPTAPTDSTGTRVAGAQQTIADLEAALRRGDVAAASALGLATTRAQLGAAADNVRRLQLDSVSLRFVEDLSATTVDGTTQYGPDSWQGTVDVTYRLRGWDPSVTSVETTMTFAPGEHGQQIAAIGTGQGRTPLWLNGAVASVASGRTLILTRDGQTARFAGLAARAISDVHRVLRSWRERLVIEAPASEQEFDRILGATQQQYANIAAVTASVDGSLAPTASVHVFLNPAVFDHLGSRGSQVVISHESTHVATAATFATMPTWLLEGFADYVALAHAGIPVGTAAAQILKQIRTSGLPTHLPTSDELSPTAGGLGATYEEAWLANRFIARTYGEAKLIAFYFAVDHGQSSDSAFRTVLRTTVDAFVKHWRADLRALSGGMTG